jgi:hypothetical protein
VFERAGQIAHALRVTAAPGCTPALPGASGPLALPIPQHVAFLARRVVAQGGILIEKEPKAAVPLAVAIAAAANLLPPELGGPLWRAVLSELHVACPLTVPCFPPRRPGQTVEGWKLELGYKNLAPPAQPGAGAQQPAVRLEAKDKYYNRLGGFVTLYAALLAADACLDFDLGSDSPQRAAPAPEPALRGHQQGPPRRTLQRSAEVFAHGIPRPPPPHLNFPLPCPYSACLPPCIAPRLPSRQAASASTVAPTRCARGAARAPRLEARCRSQSPTAARPRASARRGAGSRG